MDVTSAAKALAQNTSDLTWPEVLPQRLYNLCVPNLPTGSPLQLGEDFHAHLNKHLSGEWVPKDHYYSCSGVAEILADLGLERKSLKSEIPVKKGQLTGQADLVGVDSSGQPWVIEIKTTQRKHVLAPNSTELYQLALYAELLGYKNPTLACLRINFSNAKVGVFYAENGAPLVSQVKDLARLINLAA